MILVVDLASIPPEGLEIKGDLQAAELHLGPDEDFRLAAGGTVSCRLERAEDGSVHVRGHLSTALGLECNRCLEGFALPVDQDLDLFYLPRLARATQEEEEDVELADRDLVIAYYEGDRLDLGDVLREQLFLALPMKRLCRNECQGRCASCGANLNLGTCSCPPPAHDGDARLEVLRGLLDPSTKH
jgi:uncharacterized protein